MLPCSSIWREPGCHVSGCESTQVWAGVFDGSSACCIPCDGWLPQTMHSCTAQGTQPGCTACRRERRAATQRNLEEAAKRKAEEEKEKASQRYVRKEYKWVTSSFPTSLPYPVKGLERLTHPQCLWNCCSIPVRVAERPRQTQL